MVSVSISDTNYMTEFTSFNKNTTPLNQQYGHLCLCSQQATSLPDNGQKIACSE